MKRELIFLLILLMASTILKAEERDTLIAKKVVHHVLNDSKEWVLSPLKWDGKDWAILGGVSAATGALIAWGDQPIYNFANTLHTPFLDKLSPVIEPFGHAYLIASISGFFIQGLIAKNNYSIETSIIASESFILNTILVQSLKNLIGRTRPDVESSNPYQWNGPFKGNSFFSGHTSAAFSVASVYAYRYRETVWVPVLSYGLATILGIQRIYDNRHWASDVVFGAAVGTATGIFLCKQWENNKIKFYPTPLPGGLGMTMMIPIK
jgi:membrane-associated phospholipid phosphatase